MSLTFTSQSKNEFGHLHYSLQKLQPAGHWYNFPFDPYGKPFYLSLDQTNSPTSRLTMHKTIHQLRDFVVFPLPPKSFDVTAILAQVLTPSRVILKTIFHFSNHQTQNTNDGPRRQKLVWSKCDRQIDSSQIHRGCKTGRRQLRGKRIVTSSRLECRTMIDYRHCLVH